MAYKPYRPQASFDVPLILLTPITADYNGARYKTIPPIADGTLFYGSFKSYGGTETTVNGVYSVQDTATIETWYNPEIKSGCVIALANTEDKYEVVGDPENINLRNQFMRIKVLRVKGGA